MTKNKLNDAFHFPVMIRRLLLSWLAAATISYLVLPQSLRQLYTLDGVKQMSLSSLAVMSVIFFVAITVIGFHTKRHTYERWLMLGFYGILSFFSIGANFNWPFLIGNLILFVILILYCISGWDTSHTHLQVAKKSPAVYKVLLCILGTAFVVFVSVWTVCRIYSFCTPTYDFGIFSQMFYSMKTKGIPYTTVERDMMLSHFHVHVSPIYYLILPIYFLFPFPATLQVMQALILASSVIPLWFLCRRHGLAPAVSLIFCALLLVYPAFSAGTSYDIHENAFLTPLILWLLFAIDTTSIPITIFSACLILLVKEDAAVYVGIVALYLLIKSALRKNENNRYWGLIFGFALLIGSVVWFIIVTGYLSRSGDGVMTYRYQNFMVDGSGSLLGVIKTLLLCPEKVIYESTDPEKLKFIFLTLFPLLGLPFITRKFERYLLIIPYILVNLMSDYQYQHDIFFQYTFGSIACLMYLTVVNLADLKHTGKQCLIGSVCLALCCILFAENVVPVATRYPRYMKNNYEHYRSIHQMLEQIPDDASVAATTFYTTQLSQREILYDVKYTSTENLLSAEYVVLAKHSDTNYLKYEADGISGYDNLVQFLKANNYAVFTELDDTLVIYRKCV